jgi:hypothetical protein
MANTNGGICEGLDDCTTGGTCQDGACVGSIPVRCGHLSDACNRGVCVPGTGCVKQLEREGLACGGPVGDFCDSGGVCVAGVCVGGTTGVCSNGGDPCRDAFCAPVVGCTPVMLTGPACTPGPCYVENTGSCVAGGCTGGQQVTNGINPAGPGGGLCPIGQLCSHGVCRVCEPSGTFLSGSCFDLGGQCCGGCTDIDVGAGQCTT